jgi:hypothetical protein
VADHRAEEVDGAVDVDIVVVQRLFSRLTDGLHARDGMVSN